VFHKGSVGLFRRTYHTDYDASEQRRGLVLVRSMGDLGKFQVRCDIYGHASPSSR
jgi:hypothetical protein